MQNRRRIFTVGVIFFMCSYLWALRELSVKKKFRLRYLESQKSVFPSSFHTKVWNLDQIEFKP